MKNDVECAGTGRKWAWGWAVVLGVALAAAGWVRFADLGRAATRADEINQLRYAEQGGLEVAVGLWRNPPWFNQIPLMDGIPAVWCAWSGQGAEIGAVRQPMALMGWLTVALCAAWTWRRRGAAAGALVAVWLGLLPFHVYHSREAYYYAPLMLFGAWATLRTVDLVGKLAESREVKGREYAEWGVAALMTCLFHMSAWVTMASAWVWIAVAGWLKLAGVREGKARTRHVMWWGGVALAILAGMARWIFRALHELERADTGETAHIGSPVGWVVARLLPTLTGGLWTGIVLLVFVVAAGAWISWRGRRNGRHVIRPTEPAGGDCRSNYAVLWRLGGMACVALIATGAYVSAVGGGVGKWAYFSIAGPVWVVLCSTVTEAWWRECGERIWKWGMFGTVVLVAALLVPGAWGVTRLEGKATPYRALSASLDEVLEEGDVAIVDRWFEPWNEMAIYAPEKAVAWFTVPDEPYEQYVRLHWRDVTRQFFESGRGLGFVRLTRNHEQRMGLWTWPEKWFEHRMVVTNGAGAWLARTGYAPMEDFYLMPSRVAVEVFWNTREETAEKVLAKGASGVAFFGSGWQLVKPWQQGDWRDYRLLRGEEERGMVEVWRPQGATKERRKVVVTGTGVGGEATVRAGRGGLMRFRPGEITSQVFEEPLAGGKNVLEFSVVGGPGGVGVLDVRVE